MVWGGRREEGSGWGVSYEQALLLLRENRDVMDKLAEFLIEKETITGKEFMKIFREIKGIPEPEEEKVSETKTEKENVEADETQACTVEIEKNDSEEVSEPKDTEENMEKKTSEAENSQKMDEEPKVRGNYSKASADKLWKD